MPNRNLWSGNVPRVEYDRRARNARLRLEYLDRLLVKRDAEGFRYVELLLALLGNIAGGRRTGSRNDRPPSRIMTPRPPPLSPRGLPVTLL